MRKLFFVFCVLAILPVAVFADSPPPSLISWGIGPAAFYKSPVLLGQPTDTNNLNVDQFIFGGDLRFKVSLFQAEALVLYAGGNGVNSFDTYLDAVEFPRFCGHPELHLRLGFGEVSKHHLPSENATTAFYAQGFFLSLA